MINLFEGILEIIKDFLMYSGQDTDFYSIYKKSKIAFWIVFAILTVVVIYFVIK